MCYPPLYITRFIVVGKQATAPLVLGSAVAVSLDACGEQGFYALCVKDFCLCHSLDGSKCGNVFCPTHFASKDVALMKEGFKLVTLLLFLGIAAILVNNIPLPSGFHQFDNREVVLCQCLTKAKAIVDIEHYSVVRVTAVGLTFQLGSFLVRQTSIAKGDFVAGITVKPDDIFFHVFVHFEVMKFEDRGVIPLLLPCMGGLTWSRPPSHQHDNFFYYKGGGIVNFWLDIGGLKVNPPLYKFFLFYIGNVPYLWGRRVGIDSLLPI